MKKITALVMAAVMLVSFASVSAFAQEDELLSAFYEYCGVSMESPPSDAQIRIIDRYELGEVVYFTATSWIVAGNMYDFEEIGDYCMHTYSWNSPYELRAYVYVEGEVFDLRTAFEAGFISNVYAATNLDYITMHKAGDDVELTHACMEAFAKFRNYSPQKDEYIECYIFGEVNNLVFFRANINMKDAMVPCVCSQQRIGGYIFTEGYVYGPEDNPTGLYVLIDSEACSVPQAYEDGLVSIDEILQVVYAEPDPYNVEANVTEKLGYPSKDSSADEWSPYPCPYIYKEQYAYYSQPSSFSAADPDYILVYAAREPGAPAAPTDRIGDYAIGSYEWYDHYRHGLYVYLPADGTLYNLAEAVEAGVEGVENVFLHIGKQGGIIGDADKDGVLTVRDATYIQKIVAGVQVHNPNAYYENVVELIRDFDRNDIVNVKDATAIQKCIAGIPYK